MFCSVLVPRFGRWYAASTREFAAREANGLGRQRAPPPTVVMTGDAVRALFFQSMSLLEESLPLSSQENFPNMDGHFMVGITSLSSKQPGRWVIFPSLSHHGPFLTRKNFLLGEFWSRDTDCIDLLYLVGGALLCKTMVPS